jgi:hypothetical protein
VGDCKNKNFKFDSFNLKNNQPIKNSIYAGFVGEFVGSDFRNNINSNWNNMVISKGMNILNTKSLRDTVAYQYGNDVLVAEVNK